MAWHDPNVKDWANKPHNHIFHNILVSLIEARMHSIKAKGLEGLHTPKPIFYLIPPDLALDHFTFLSWQAVGPAYDILIEMGALTFLVVNKDM